MRRMAAGSVSGSLYQDITDGIGQVADRVAAAQAAVNQRLLLGTEEVPALRRVGQIFRDVTTAAAGILTRLEEVRADTSITTRGTTRLATGSRSSEPPSSKKWLGASICVPMCS